MGRWMIVAALSGLVLLGMGTAPRFLEELKIGGGYGEEADGGADLDRAGNIATDGKVVAEGGIDAGREGTARGVTTVWDGGGPGCLRLGTTNGNAGYVFLSNDLAGLRVCGTLPTGDADGSWLVCGRFRGTGSTTDAVDLGTAEVAGTLPASNVGAGLADGQVVDNLTIAAGTVDNTPIGAAVPSSGRFTGLACSGDLVVDGGDIGISADADLLGLASNEVTVRGTLVSSAGTVEAGTAGSTRGIVSACSNGSVPGSLKLTSANGTASYLFATNDRAGLRIGSAAPASDTDGTWLVSGAFRGTGSTTDAVDLGSAEVAGTLPPSNIGSGLSDGQIADNLSIAGGTINLTPIGAMQPSTGRFSSLASTGDLLVDGGDIGITADADLVNMTAGLLTVRGTMGAGVEDTTAGGLRLYGDNSGGGGWLALENGANQDGATNGWALGCGLFGTLLLRAEGGSAGLGTVLTVNPGSGDVSFGYDVTAQGGDVNAGSAGVTRGTVSVFSAGTAPGCLRMDSSDESTYYVFVTNDGKGLRINSTEPASDTDGAWLAAGTFYGSGSATGAVDLGTAEVAGTLPASSVGNGLTNAQVNDNLTISGGAVDGTPIGATTASTAVFSKVTVQGALVTNNIMNIVANDTSPDVANTHICKVPNTWTSGYDITMFDNGSAGQELIVMGGDTDCTVEDTGHLRLAGNWPAASYSTLTLVFDGFDWLETGRSSN